MVQQPFEVNTCIITTINEETETEKLSSLPKVMCESQDLVPGQWTPQPLCFTLKCQWLGCLGLQFSVPFSIIASLLPHIQN